MEYTKNESGKQIFSWEANMFIYQIKVFLCVPTSYQFNDI